MAVYLIIFDGRLNAFDCNRCSSRGDADLFYSTGVDCLVDYRAENAFRKSTITNRSSPGKTILIPFKEVKISYDNLTPGVINLYRNMWLPGYENVPRAFGNRGHRESKYCILLIMARGP